MGKGFATTGTCHSLARRMVSASLNAVTRTMAIVGARRRIASMTSRPFIFGIARSVTTRSQTRPADSALFLARRGHRRSPALGVGGLLPWWWAATPPLRMFTLGVSSDDARYRRVTLTEGSKARVRVSL